MAENENNMNKSESSAVPYKLIKADSVVVTCGCCGRWLGRMPKFLGIEGEWDCECGCTSVKVRDGRPYGPKSREWTRVNGEFNDLWRFIEEVDDVTTEPPFRSLDAP